MAEYANRLEDPALRARVRGFLTGSIDLVIRLPGPRFALVDCKTNWLGPADEPLTLAHYRPEYLAAEMSRAHYSLQALLYTVALHRSPAGRPGPSPSPDGLCSPGTRVGLPQPLNSVTWPSRNCCNASSVSGRSGNR